MRRRDVPLAEVLAVLDSEIATLSDQIKWALAQRYVDKQAIRRWASEKRFTRDRLREIRRLALRLRSVAV